MECSDKPWVDLAAEAKTVLPSTRALRAGGAGWGDVLRFWGWRICSSETPTTGRPWRSPEGLRLYSRREFISYREVILMDEYDRSLWQREFVAIRDPVVIDAGANLGFFSALALSLNPGSRLRCFEMMPECCEVLNRRMEELGAKDYEVTNAAVGACEADQVAIHYDVPYALGNSLCRQKGRYTHRVPQVSLDAWLQRQPVLVQRSPRLVKIDVEGTEHDVFAGGSACIAGADMVLMEIHGAEMLDLIESLSQSHRIISHRQKDKGVSVCIGISR